MRMPSRLALVPVAVAGLVALAATPALAAPSDQDVTWMQSAHQSNLAEIAAGEAAQQSATTQEVRDLGAVLVADHSTLDQSLTQAAEEFGVELPAEPTAAQQAALARVQEQSGRAFDSAWIAAQITGHVNSAAATQQEIATGTDPQVVELARTALPVIQGHLERLRALAGEFGVPTSVPGGTGGQAADGGAGALGVGLVGVGALAVLGGTVGLVRRRQTAA
ncbi:DUF4142 domain-containing protein [Modestobacter sp. VKM Ac-2983]|uniref:DUF4142 domain-containing protein n=1 Tax=Modestobacter sp. VKM Ac-2983 TaxID=3004137 RepID=UPI0022ABA98E|nr:DUF4142 domain-containing protein [Modestobacter sp. VKM Ac-2983]MCZ2804273.1 DUF4142 domain-containing protein [Modestobacter sp. VKM Ac-2983]